MLPQHPPRTSQRLDILYVITDLEIGGVPLHLERLARAMRDRGHGLAVVSLKSTGPVGESLRAAGVQVLACEGRGGWDLRVVGRLAAFARELRPRVVHSLLFHANLAARWAAERADVPPGRLICEIQTVEVERPWHLWVERLAHFGCRFTIGNSPSVIDHLAEKARIPRDRLRLVRGGIDPAPIREAAPLPRSELGGIAVETPLLLWVGRLDAVKGLDYLLAAFRIARDRTGGHLVLVGGGPQRERLEAQIVKLELGERVHLTGPRRDVPRLLRTCDLFVFPSRTEGLPNAVLEAMAAGCPIVATDVPGNRDLIRAGENGLLVRYGDVAGLAAALIRLIEDRELAGRLGEEAARTIDREWHVTKTLDEYEALYHQVFSQEPSARSP